MTHNLLFPKLPFGKKAKKLFWILGILVLVLMFCPWISFTVGRGQITAIDPNERVQTITASVDGFIGTWHVKEGQYLKSGQLIVDLIDTDPEYLKRLGNQLAAAKTAADSAKLMEETARIDFDRQNYLYKQGLSSRKDYELAKIKHSKMTVDLASKQASYAKAQVDLARQSSQRIVAPRPGIVTRILPGEKGQLIKKGSPIVIFTPEVTNPAVEIWIDGNDTAMLIPGQTAQIQFEGWPNIQIPGWPSIAIGTFRGKVYLVDQASSMDGKFRVLLVPNGAWPSQKLLRLGMQAKGFIKLRDSFVLREIWRIMNGFPPLRKPIQDELDKILSSKPGFNVNAKEESK